MLLHWHQLRLKHSSLSVRVKVIRWDVRTRTLAAFTHRNPLFYFVIWAECFAFFFFLPGDHEERSCEFERLQLVIDTHTEREGERERESVKEHLFIIALELWEKEGSLGDFSSCCWTQLVSNKDGAGQRGEWVQTHAHTHSVCCWNWLATTLSTAFMCDSCVSSCTFFTGSLTLHTSSCNLHLSTTHHWVE